MTLPDERLAQIIAAQKETLGIVKEVLDVVNQIKGDVDDSLADLKKELEQKIHMLDVFCKDTLEKNQQTIWKKLLTLSGEEVEPTKDPNKTTEP